MVPSGCATDLSAAVEVTYYFFEVISSEAEKSASFEVTQKLFFYRISTLENHFGLSVLCTKKLSLRMTLSAVQGLKCKLILRQVFYLQFISQVERMEEIDLRPVVISRSRESKKHKVGSQPHL